MGRQRRDSQPAMDTRIYFLLYGKRAPEVPEENRASDFIFRGSRREQKALWAAVGRDLMKANRRPWALEKYGPPEQADTGP
jgi:hypothetical protein